MSAVISGQHCCDKCFAEYGRDDRDIWISWIKLGNGELSRRCRCKITYLDSNPESNLASGTHSWTRGSCQRQSSRRKKRSSGAEFLGTLNGTNNLVLSAPYPKIIQNDPPSKIIEIVQNEFEKQSLPPGHSVTINKRQVPAVIETEEEIEMRSFGSQLRYECGSGRRFFDTELEEHYEERWMTCNWNLTWTKYESLDECVWIQCINPPPPPEGIGLVSNYEGEPVEFYDNNTYVCLEGLYFEWDRDMPEFNITCLPGGAWDEPLEWPICLGSKSISY